MEHSHREAEANIQTTTNHLADLLSRHTATDTRVRQNEEKIKTDEQTVRDLAARVALLPTNEDVASVRRDLNDKVCFRYPSSSAPLLFGFCSECACFLSLPTYQIRTDLQKSLQQQEENNSQATIKLEQRINSIRVDLNLLEEQINQRLTHVSCVQNFFHG